MNKPVMYKIELPILDEEARPVSAETVTQIELEYDLAGAGHEFTAEEKREIAGRGRLLDVRQQLLAVIVRPDNPNAGVGMEEMDRIRPIYQKLKGAGAGGEILLSTQEFDVLRNKLKLPFAAQYNYALDRMIHTILGTDPVQVREVEAG